MALINLHNVDVSVGGPRPLLEAVELGIEADERVCVVGRNGTGKSTLLRLLAGEMEPDDGRVRFQRGIRVAKLTQEVPAGTHGTVFDVVAHALGNMGDLLAEFHRLSQGAVSEADVEAMGRVQARLDAEGGWDVERRVSEVITRLGLDESADFARLSGGMKRRVLLAQALATAPDVLLLDEPTNHLDIDNIRWLEGFLKDFGASVVFVTHDRSFLRSLATRIVEIDRGLVTSWPGDYDNFLRRREERLNAEAQEQKRFDKKLAQEEAWIRQGVKARRKRNMGRVRQLQELRRQRAQRREHTGQVRLEASEARGSGKRVVEAEGVSVAFDGQPIIGDFSTTILRGDRVGIVGPNGSGKTSLIRLLLGELAPDAGSIYTGTNLQVAYFDQQRAQLDERATAMENVAGGQDFVTINGANKHVMTYLQDFLFSPARARAPITKLSGGERNRLLLARLFAQPSNVLVLDEPTNDLDIETLELLEELVGDYKGTVLLVSHDRAFLDHVVTSVLVLEGGGRVTEYVGGYSDWLEHSGSWAPATAGPSDRKSKDKRAKPNRAASEQGAGERRLSSREQAELEALPERIERLEQRIDELGTKLGDPKRYAEGGDDVADLDEQLRRAQAELDEAFERWAALDARQRA
ncbi:MAG: ABC transporter ATP-binding protein [Proteobacteria bacterium SW_6_67_9]|nr:MAG: ABC transporter ATP-binding protein [Proteobacteria bacterium SW_6_67_9]